MPYKCKSVNCTKQANYNYENIKGGLYCNDHKLINMIDVLNKHCSHDNCKKRAVYNFINMKPKFCFNHKLENMIDVNAKKCKFEGCIQLPYYNFPENKKTLYCYDHKIKGMIDVTEDYCQYDECNKIANFNYHGFKKGIYCSRHKENDMIDINNKKCFIKNCNKFPIYNYENNKPKYCIDHKLDNMINTRSKRCKTLLCDTQISNPLYDGYCLRCYVHLNPDKPISRNFKTKESTVTKYLIDEFPTLKWDVDKKIDNGISKRRPDLLLNLDHQVVIVEIDENQHNEYDCICENKRLMEISQDLKHKTIVFIRFNPDSYIDKNGKKVKSPWLINNLGLCSISKDNKKEWEERLDKLADIVDYWCDDKNKTNKTIEVVELYYDQGS